MIGLLAEPVAVFCLGFGPRFTYILIGAALDPMSSLADDEAV